MYIFCHIPKTAGTSLNYVLRKNFKYKLYSPIELNLDDIAVNRLTRRMPYLEVLSGHNLKPHLIHREVRWFTFMRNPNERLVSHYVHQYSSGIDAYKLSFEQWLKKFNRSNMHVKWLGGDLDRAYDNLSRMSFIGLTERFEESLVLLGATLGMKDLGHPTYMISRNKDLFEETCLKFSDLASDHNRCDWLLYEKAQELYDLQTKSYGVDRLHRDVENQLEYLSGYVGSRRKLITYHLHTKVANYLL